MTGRTRGFLKFHKLNFGRMKMRKQYSVCPICKKKGVLHYRLRFYGIDICKYCKYEKTTEKYNRKLHQWENLKQNVIKGEIET